MSSTDSQPKPTRTQQEQHDMVVRDLASRSAAFAAWRGRFGDIGKDLLKDRGSRGKTRTWWDREAQGQLFSLSMLLAGYRADRYNHAAAELERVLTRRGYVMHAERVPTAETQAYTLITRRPEEFIALGHWYAQDFNIDENWHPVASEELRGNHREALQRLMDAYPGLEDNLIERAQSKQLDRFMIDDAITEMRRERTRSLGGEGDRRFYNHPDVRYNSTGVYVNNTSAVHANGFLTGMFVRGDRQEAIGRLHPGDRDGVVSWTFRVPVAQIREVGFGQLYFFNEANPAWQRHRPALVSTDLNHGYGAAFEPGDWWETLENKGVHFAAQLRNDD